MEQDELLRHVVAVLGEMDVPYMLVGSYGSGAWGEPRFTQDIDIVVSLSADDAPVLLRAFPFPEYLLSEEAVRQALRTRGQFNIIHSGSAAKIDVMLSSRDTWGRTEMARRRRMQITGDLTAFVASPEDIILGKLLYYKEGRSDKHLRDIAGILRISPEQVDRQYVLEWARRLGVLDLWQAVLDRLAADR